MAAENLSPQIISRVLSEIRDLTRSAVEGISYWDTDSDTNSLSEIHALITGPEGTPYLNGRFRLKLVLSGEYPTVPPKGYFLTKIYHPNVAPSTGEICVNTLKKDWTPDVTLKHILQVIRCLLIVPFPESSLNDEAGKLFMDSYDDFAQRARIMTRVHALDNTDENSEESSAGAASTAVSSSSQSSETVKVATAAAAAKKKSLKRL